MRIVVNKHGLVYLDFGRAGSISLQLYLTYHRLLHVRVAVNSHALPVHKKNRITSLLCIFETIIQLEIRLYVHGEGHVFSCPGWCYFGMSLVLYILRKTIEGYQNSFDYLTFEKIISKQSIFVFDRTTNMQFLKNAK